MVRTPGGETGLRDAIACGSICGVQIRVHVFSILLLVVVLLQVLVVAGLEGFVLFTVHFGLVVASLLVHELGHAVAAKSLGVRVFDIVISPIGGMARLERLPDNPRVEMIVAAAGPLANLLLVAIVIASLALLGATDLAFPDAEVGSHVRLLLFVNLLMGMVNLIPAFPMDGGRIFRALLAQRVPYLRATEIAVWVGRGVAVALVAISLVRRELLAFSLLAGFLWMVGERELRAAAARPTEPQPPDPSSDQADAESPSSGNHCTPAARRFLLLSQPGPHSEGEQQAIAREMDALGSRGRTHPTADDS